MLPENVRWIFAPFWALLFHCVQPLNLGKFWHVTDFHYDTTYWSTRLSCNAEVTHQLPFGDYWCDSPWRLITSAIDAMEEHEPDVDFLLWTGDTVAHISDDHLSLNINMDIVKNLTDALTSAFPSKKVYATFGNHDYYPTDQFPAVNNLIYNRTADMWQHWIVDQQQLNNFRKGGYYTLVTQHGLRILALNTNLYYNKDPLTKGIQDPSDQIHWMRQVLQDARDNSQKVLVTAHIPPGVHTPDSIIWFHEEFVQPLNNALEDFADVIVGMHFGHDHSDGFKVFLDKQGQARVPVFVAPSVTPWRFISKSGEPGPPHNPAVRLVTYDRDSGKHLELEQLRMDLVTANSQNNSIFTRLYNFTTHYGVPDITAASLDKLMRRMGTGTEGDKLLDDYFNFATTGADQGSRKCDRKCKFRILCGLRHHDMQSFDACVQGYVGGAGSLTSSLIWVTSLALIGRILSSVF